MKKTKQILSTFALLAPLAFCQPAKAEGIDCSKATNYMDKIVCANADVKAQDATMAQLYAVARVNMFGKGPSGEIARQKIWLSNWNNCAALAADKRADCVLDQYKTRNFQLAFSAMPKAPEAALKVLRDQKIETAAVYEALTIFASEADGADWFSPALREKQAKIIELISPVIEELKKEVDAEHPNKRFATQLLGDAGISKATDVLASSGGFAGFLRAATFESQAPLPCGYVITHQALLDSTNAYFGATPDNSIMKTDCGAMAPATPKFHALLELIDHNWPQCDGTIRFAAFRSYSVAIDRVLTPSAKAIENFKFELPRKQEVQHTLEGVSRKSTTDAETEMANYYSKYLSVTHAKARTFAKSKIADVLYRGHQCE
jgi:uncharacterized protein